MATFCERHTSEVIVFHQSSLFSLCYDASVLIFFVLSAVIVAAESAVVSEFVTARA